MAAKRLNTTYWGGNDLYNDADIPAKADMSFGATYCDCNNIKLSAVYDLITGSHTGPLSLYTICETDATFVLGGESGKINAWARYKPGYVTYDVELPVNCNDNPTFLYNKPNPSKLGDWAGYKHTENTMPVYWSSAPSGNMGSIIEGGATTDITSTLQRGKLACVLQGDPEDEYYWGRVKVQIYTRVDSDAYSLFDTTDFIDLSDSPVLYTIGGNGETQGHTYYVCLRPVYMDVDDTTPLAVCEGGVAEFYYGCFSFVDWIDDNGGVTIVDNPVTPTTTYFGAVGGGDPNHTYVDFDFYLNSGLSIDLTIDVELRAINFSMGEHFEHSFALPITIPASGSYHFEANEDDWACGLIIDDGFFDLECWVSIPGSGVWSNLGMIASSLQCWSSL